MGTRRWKNQDDPTDVGKQIDADYLHTDTTDEAVTDAYEPTAQAVTDGGQPIDARSDAAASDTSTEATDELDANPMTTTWAFQGVQRTTLYADDTDAHGNPLPKWGADGTDLRALRYRHWKYNSGFGWNDYSDVGRVDMDARETREMTEAVSSQCGLTEFQQERAVQIALDMDGRRWNWAGGRPAMALVAVTRAATDSKREAIERFTDDTDEPTTFESVAEKDCGTDPSKMITKIFE